MMDQEKAKEQLSLPYEHQINDLQAMKDYVLAGNSKFTLRSQVTGDHLTFKIRQGSQRDVWWVSRLAEGYEYIGMIDRYGVFRWTQSVPMQLRSCAHFKAFSWFWARLNLGSLSGQLQFYHRGKCGKCGRDLTDPVSIKAGFGPECRKSR